MISCGTCLHESARCFLYLEYAGESQDSVHGQRNSIAVRGFAMKIRSQLLAVIGSAVLIVSISSLYAAQQHNKAQKLKTLALNGEQAIAAVYKFETASRAIQTDAGSYKDSLSNWLTISEETNAKLETLFEKSERLNLSASIVEPVQSLREKWPKVQDYITTLQGLFEELGQSPARIYVNMLGIVKAQIQLGTDPTANFADFQILSRILDNFQSTVLFTVNVTQDLAALNEKLVSQANASSTQASVITFASLAIAVAIAFGLTFLYSSRLALRIHRLEQVMKEMANKNLAKEAQDTSSDELGKLSQHINEVISIMRAFIQHAQNTATGLEGVETTLIGNATDLQNSSAIIVDSTNDIANRIEELDKNIGTSIQASKQVGTILVNFVNLAESQANNLERISTAVEEMAASMNNVSKLVESRLSNLNELQTAIHRGFEEAANSSEILTRAKRELESISEISDMISDVAEKTNVLSMNAAIESAHAGASGKGFAVVAEEIRKLSDTAQDNASNIEKLVKSIAVSLNNSSQSAAQSRQVLEETKKTVEGFVDAFSEIGSSTRELSQATKEILEAVSNINVSSQTIKQEGSHATEWSKKIEETITIVGTISDHVVKHIKNIQGNISVLSSALSQMNSLVETTGARSSELDAMLCEFNVTQACETEPAENTSETEQTNATDTASPSVSTDA